MLNSLSFITDIVYVNLSQRKGNAEFRSTLSVEDSAAVVGGPVVLDCSCPNWDILIDIQASLAQLPLIKLQHVKGDQDRERGIRLGFTKMTSAPASQ
jgi:hypothetical protein